MFDNELIKIIVSSLASAFVTFLVTRYSIDVSLRYGVQALLRDRMIQIYEKLEKKKWCTIEEKQNFYNLYTWYHKLGQNGVMTDTYNKILKLPCKIYGTIPDDTQPMDSFKKEKGEE